jgi:hypothetical protein
VSLLIASSSSIASVPVCTAPQTASRCTCVPRYSPPYSKFAAGAYAAAWAVTVLSSVSRLVAVRS